MANPIVALSRLFKRKPKNTLLAELYGRAIGKPLFAHADMGGQILKGYLSAQLLDMGEDSADAQPVHSVFEGIGLIDVSGALVSRPMGLCSPLSYTEVSNSLTELIEDPAVKAVVLRLDSPGGEAAGMLDLSDQIFNARGVKPIIAAVDDNAYSACYAIASACDRIVLSRTGGVGSVGVVSYHIDQSEYNAKKGVKVEYIYAGDRKVDGNPDAPLSDSGRNAMQAEINRLYDLFVDTVARNRGMDPQAVRDTQAGCFFGQTAIDMGFADAVLSFSQLMHELTHETFVLPKLSKPQPLALGEQPVLTEGAKVEQLAEANLPQASQVRQDDNAYQDEVKALCAAAGLPSVAKAYINSQTPIEDVRADLMDVQTAGEVEIKTARSTEQSPTPYGLDINSIYSQRKKGA